eukprot:2065211-Pleurochrysis_carterae.AAC.2
MHTDNAGDLTSKQIRQFLLQQGACGLQLSRHTCPDRMEHASDSGAQWRVACELSWRLQNCQLRTGGIT